MEKHIVCKRVPEIAQYAIRKLKAFIFKSTQKNETPESVYKQFLDNLRAGTEMTLTASNNLNTLCQVAAIQQIIGNSAEGYHPLNNYNFHSFEVVQAWIWFWTTLFEKGKVIAKTVMNKVGVLSAYCSFVIGYLKHPECDSELKQMESHFICLHEMLKLEKTRWLDLANSSKVDLESISEMKEKKKWLMPSDLKKIVSKASKVLRRASFWIEKNKRVTYATAVRVQDALIALLQISCGGQRTEFVHLFQVRSIKRIIQKDGSICFSASLAHEKTKRLDGSHIPLPTHLAKMLNFFLKHIRPILLSTEDKEIFDRYSNATGVEKKRIYEEELIKSMWINQASGPGSSSNVASCLKRFIVFCEVSATNATGLDARRAMVTYVVQLHEEIVLPAGMSHVVYIEEYARLVNTSVSVMLNYYNRSIGMEKSQITLTAVEPIFTSDSIRNQIPECTEYMDDISDLDELIETIDMQQDNDYEASDLSDLDENEIKWLKSHIAKAPCYNLKSTGAHKRKKTIKKRKLVDSEEEEEDETLYVKRKEINDWNCPKKRPVTDAKLYSMKDMKSLAKKRKTIRIQEEKERARLQEEQYKVEFYNSKIDYAEEDDEEEQSIWEVDEIVDRKVKIVNGREFIHYQVIWKDGSKDWQPEENLINCDIALGEYYKSLGKEEKSDNDSCSDEY